jgi:hypothetical protein
MLGAFKTTPIYLLDVEASIIPADIRLNHLQRNYACRTLYLNKNHPIRLRIPDNFPPEHYIGRELDGGIGLNWNDNKINIDKTTIDLILSRINFLVAPTTIIEDINLEVDSP